jgi:nucleoside-diphosphate-sugar epimerase
VYGNPDVLPITEEHHTGNVTNVYGRTKFFIEEMLKDISAAEKVKLYLLQHSLILSHYPRNTIASHFWDIPKDEVHPDTQIR